MSEHALQSDISLTDSLERSMMNKALSNGEPVSITKIGKAVKTKLMAFWNYMVELSDYINEARAKSERLARSHW